MYLKSIEMQGFKSFPDRTKLVFDSRENGPLSSLPSEAHTGVTVIVGPNGSGKSNIADAMRWVLGEISSKTLRGSKMEDVIFGGADSRRPMGYAEVSVTFDNQSGYGRLDCSYDEVTVTRRCFRAGESEYFINRKAVRLKDIYELFLNTGIGRDGYSIIGQGRIAEIVSRKSEERRNIFEDASGIAKFRVKKSEAERKLSQVETNLVRIRDIFSEVESQLGPLEKEAERAKKGMTLLEAKKQADVRLWLYDTEHVGKEMAEAEELRGRAEFDLQKAEDSLQALDVQNQRLAELSRNSRKNAEDLQNSITEWTNTRHRLDSEYQVAEANRLRTGEMVTSTEESSAASVERRDADRAERDAHRIEETQLNGKIADLETSSSDLKKQADTLRDRIRELDTKIAVSGADIHGKEQEQADLQIRMSVLENARHEGYDRNSGIREEMNAYEETSRSLRDKAETSRLASEKYASAEKQMREELDTLTAGQEQLSGEYRILNERFNAETLRCDSVRQRIHTYRAMEENYEGYASSVRFVMNQYRSGHIRRRDGSSAGQIYGPLSQIIRVDSPYVTAVEVALGANLQHIVVDDEETAKAAVNTLKRGEAGRATFFPLSAMRGQNPTPDMQKSAGFAGYVAVASALVDCDDPFRAVVSSLLGRTVIFDTIDHAQAMAKALHYRVRAVTLDGQEIHVGGSITGGSTRKNGVLSRADEMRRLKTDLGGLEKKAQLTKQAMQELKTRIDRAEQEMSDCQDKKDLNHALWESEMTRLKQAQAQLEANETLLARLKEDCASVLRKSEQAQEDLNALRSERESLNRVLDELRTFREEKAAEKGEAEEELDRLSETETRLCIDLSSLRKDLDTEKTLEKLCEERIASHENDIRINRERAEAYRTKMAEYDRILKENREEYRATETKLADLLSDRTRAEEATASLDGRLSALAEKIREEMENKERLFREFTLSDTKLENFKAAMEKLTGQLWDDYEMTRADAENAHYPPVTAENRKDVASVQMDCRNKLRSVGHFDPEAVEKYREVRERAEAMGTQLSDLEAAKSDLTGIISRLGVEMETAFVESFRKINDNFSTVFTELFGGGNAEILLTDPEHVLESGIEIKASPPGKIINNLMQLSGGEQAFVGIALFFAVLKVNPSPFCILDEIEAALDEANVERLATYVKRYSEETQFIMITHRRGTMAAADRLYGVTMPEKGISKVLTLDVGDISKSKENEWNGIFDESLRTETPEV